MKATRWFVFVIAGAVLLACPGCTIVNKENQRADRISQSPSDDSAARGQNGNGAEDRVRISEFTVNANRSPLVRLQKRVPPEVVHGQEFTYDLVITAINDAQDIVVTDTIPSGASFVRSNPAANRDAHQLLWRFPGLKKDDAEWIRVWLKADTAGELAGCATISAAAQNCVATVAGTPQLDLRVVAPESATMNFVVPALIVVSNRGTITARDVLVRYKLPEGLAQSGREQPLIFDAGDLAPGQARSLKLQLKPAARGRAQLQATATSSNAPPVEAVVATSVAEPKLQITLDGPDEAYIHKQAAYKLTLQNTGDATLTSIVVTHEAGSRASVIEAPEADTVRARSATWKLDSLRPGDRRIFDVVLSASTPGKREHTATVTTAEGVEERAGASIDWQGVSALSLELADSPDPVQVGHQTVFTIRVSNQGTATERDITIVANLPAQLSPVKTSAGEFQGNTIRFPAVAELPARKSVEYRVIAKGKAAGDARVRVELRSAGLKTPVIEEESTRVY